jgi:hypothetical protein
MLEREGVARLRHYVNANDIEACTMVSHRTAASATEQIKQFWFHAPLGRDAIDGLCTNSDVEPHIPKLDVAGSNPVARSVCHGENLGFVIRAPIPSVLAIRFADLWLGLKFPDRKGRSCEWKTTSNFPPVRV